MKEDANYYIERYETRRKNRMIRISILVILILIVVITSFKSGQKFYEIKNTNFDSVSTKVDSNIAKWKFKVKIIY
ncbi:MAG: hypothetical protein HFJ46_06860 [Clostridia bacterium]|nr:hypothetical protein [Clostridia bacterium]